MAVIAKGSRDNRSRNTDGNTGKSGDLSNFGLTNFTTWKQAAVEEIIKDEDLLKLLYYDTEDALSKPALTEAQINTMISPGDSQQIFQYRHITNLATHKKSYLSMDLAYFKPLEELRLFSEKYISGYFYIFILCDRDIMEIHQGIRPDLILKHVYQILDGLDARIGMGELKLETQLPLWPDNSSFGGYSVGFKVSDLK